MPNKEIIYYIKNESSSDLLYHIVVAALDRLVELNKASAVKAVLDAGTTALYKMAKR